MQPYRTLLIRTLLGISTFTLFTACDTEEIIIQQPRLTIRIQEDAQYGRILVDQANRSMYFFASDINAANSNCNGDCADAWPPVLGEADRLQLGSNVLPSDFGTVSRQDGQRQLTFKGWPLYYFSPQADGVLEQPGVVSGDGVRELFHVAKPNYSVLLGHQSIVAGEAPVTYLVTDRGATLYHNTADEEERSSCSGACTDTWRPFRTHEQLFPSTLRNAQFKNIERRDSFGTQDAINGRPLYFFLPDKGVKGSVLGHASGPYDTFFVVEL